MNRLSIVKVGFMLVAPLLLSGCIDDDYDLSDIDGTVELQVKDLTIPMNLDDIKLTNIIEISENGQIKIVDDKYVIIEDGEFDTDEIEVPMVYANSYDGYLNVRAQPTTRSQVLGTLRNGPEGAVLLGVEGKWVKVRVNGIEGYVWAADTQSYPSDPVNISADSVIGEWVWCDENAHFDSCTIESNGKFYMSGYLSMETSGKWHLSGNNLVLKHNNGQKTVCGVTGRTLIINNREYAKN